MSTEEHMKAMAVTDAKYQELREYEKLQLELAHPELIILKHKVRV